MWPVAVYSILSGSMQQFVFVTITAGYSMHDPLNFIYRSPHYILCLFSLQTDPSSLPCSQQPGESRLHPHPPESLYCPAVAVSAVPPKNVTPCATEHLVFSARSDLSVAILCPLAYRSSDR